VTRALSSWFIFVRPLQIVAVIFAEPRSHVQTARGFGP
jgi:hypothetical protein